MSTSLSELLPLLAQLSDEREDPRPLAELASALNRSPSHFQRTFKRLVGESPKQLQRRLRLELAAVRLLVGDESILDVALGVGFDSHEGFTRAFRSHFGVSPKAFRNRQRGGDPQLLEHYASLIQHVGPCVGLYRVSTKPPTTTVTGTPPMSSYDITQETIEAQTVLYRSTRCEAGDIAKALGELLPSVFRYATESGIAMVGPPYTRYLSFGPALVSIEAGLPIAAGAKGEGDIQVGELPAGKAVVTVHTGPYDGLGDAHGAVQRFIESNGFEPGGAPWEVYLTDPGEVPDPAEWKTKVVWPLAE